MSGTAEPQQEASWEGAKEVRPIASSLALLDQAQLCRRIDT